MIWFRPNSLDESVKPLKVTPRDRWARANRDEGEGSIDALEALHENFDELSGEFYLDPDGFFSSWRCLPPETRLRLA